MVKQKVRDFLYPLDLHEEEAYINEKIAKKEAIVFGILSEKEKTRFAQEIALEIGLEHFLHVRSRLENLHQFDLEQTRYVTHYDERIGFPEAHTISNKKWAQWVTFFLSLFAIEFEEESVFKMKFTVRLLNGMIVECISPFYFEHFNLFKEENEPLDAVRYVFKFYPSRTPQPAEYAKKYLFTKETEQFFKDALTRCFNIVFASSNETDLEALSQLAFHFMDLDERVARIEKKGKIRTNLFHQLTLKVTDQHNTEALLKASLHMHPDRLFVDVLDKESVFHFVQACNTGHDGSIASYIVDSLEKLKEELVTGFVSHYQVPKKIAHTSIAQAVDLILFIEEKEGSKVLSFYRYEENELIYLVSEDQKTIRTENFSEGMRYKMKRHQAQIEEKPVQVTKKEMQSVDIEAFINAYTKKHPFEKMEQLATLLSPTILLSRDIKKDESISIGTSKFGGNPDLPKDLDYPFQQNIPYSFIMQLNCEELSPYDREGVFPSKGMLYFFHQFEEEMVLLPYDFEGEEGLKDYLKSTKIFHFEGDVASLKRVEKPKSRHTEKVKSAKIQFVSSYTLPDWYEEEAMYTDLGFTEEEFSGYVGPFTEALKTAHYASTDESFDEPLHQLLGHALPVQGSPHEELIDDLRERFEQPDVKKEAWSLLCQLEVDDDLNMRWAADGCMYYYIEKNALISRNFQSIYSIMQC